MQKKLNLKIKFREGFRPFAPSVLIESVEDYFDTNYPSPYMLLIAHVRKERRNPQNITDQLHPFLCCPCYWFGF